MRIYVCACTLHYCTNQSKTNQSKQSFEMRNQLGRRNLSPVDFKLALGRRCNRSKKANDGSRGNQHTGKDQNDTCQESTAAKLATQHGVSVLLVELGNDGKEGAGGIVTQWWGVFDRTH